MVCIRSCRPFSCRFNLAQMALDRVKMARGHWMGWYGVLPSWRVPMTGIVQSLDGAIPDNIVLMPRSLNPSSLLGRRRADSNSLRNLGRRRKRLRHPSKKEWAARASSRVASSAGAVLKLFRGRTRSEHRGDDQLEGKIWDRKIDEEMGEWRDNEGRKEGRKDGNSLVKWYLKVLRNIVNKVDFSTQSHATERREESNQFKPRATTSLTGPKWARITWGIVCTLLRHPSSALACGQPTQHKEFPDNAWENL